MFKKLEGDQAMLRQNGVFKPCDLYTFAGGLYAKISGGYVRLRSDGTTTKDGMSFHYLESDVPLFKDRFGRLSVENGKGYKSIELKLDGQGTTLMIEKE